MIQRILYTCLVCLFLGANSVFGQIDKILKPVEINPPTPPPPHQVEQEKQSDEQLASQYFQNKEFDKAAVLYEKLYEKKPNSFYYTYYLFCLLELHEFSKAERLAKKQIKKFPTRLKFIVDLGYVYSESGDQNKAKKQFENAIHDIQPDKSLNNPLLNKST